MKKSKKYVIVTVCLPKSKLAGIYDRLSSEGYNPEWRKNSTGNYDIIRPALPDDPEHIICSISSGR
jgi:hypothetical protein